MSKHIIDTEVLQKLLNLVADAHLKPIQQFLEHVQQSAVLYVEKTIAEDSADKKPVKGKK